MPGPRQTVHCSTCRTAPTYEACIALQRTKINPTLTTVHQAKLEASATPHWLPPATFKIKF